MVYTWVADITPLMKNRDLYKEIYKAVPEFRKEKADRIRKLDGRAQSLGVWWILMQMRKTYHLDEDAVFNLSHSGNYALCSIDDNKKRVLLGCDIETLKEEKLKIAHRFFCNSEIEYIENAGNKKEAFYRMWVLKESFLKAIRMGIALDMHDFEVSFDQEDRPFLKRLPEQFSGPYFYHEYNNKKIEAKIAVCSSQNIFDHLKEYRFL